MKASEGFTEWGHVPLYLHAKRWKSIDPHHTQWTTTPSSLSPHQLEESKHRSKSHSKGHSKSHIISKSKSTNHSQKSATSKSYSQSKGESVTQSFLYTSLGSTALLHLPNVVLDPSEYVNQSIEIRSHFKFSTYQAPVNPVQIHITNGDSNQLLWTGTWSERVTVFLSSENLGTTGSFRLSMVTEKSNEGFTPVFLSGSLFLDVLLYTSPQSEIITTLNRSKSFVNPDVTLCLVNEPGSQETWYPWFLWCATIPSFLEAIHGKTSSKRPQSQSAEDSHEFQSEHPNHSHVQLKYIKQKPTSDPPYRINASVRTARTTANAGWQEPNPTWIFPRPWLLWGTTPTSCPELNETYQSCENPDIFTCLSDVAKLHVSSPQEPSRNAGQVLWGTDIALEKWIGIRLKITGLLEPQRLGFQTWIHAACGSSKVRIVLHDFDHNDEKSMYFGSWRFHVTHAISLDPGLLVRFLKSWLKMTVSENPSTRASPSASPSDLITNNTWAYWDTRELQWMWTANDPSAEDATTNKTSLGETNQGPWTLWNATDFVHAPLFVQLRFENRKDA